MDTVVIALSRFMVRTDLRVALERLHQQFLRITKTEQHVKEHPLFHYVKPTVLGPSTTWKTFSKQTDAIFLLAVMEVATWCGPMKGKQEKPEKEGL